MLKPVLPALLFVLLLLPARLPAQIINTIAGTGLNVYNGDSLSGPLTTLNYPTDVAHDIDGNILISDCYNNRIRKLDLATGLVSTIAGTGALGFSGDGGPATAAVFNVPGSIAVDEAGNVYIHDIENYRIRKITRATGIITTIIGSGKKGPGGDQAPALSEINYSSGIAVDKAGNVYFAECGSNRVRMLKVSDNMLYAVAGNFSPGYTGDSTLATQARLEWPTDVYVDSANNMFIIDQYSSIIRRVDGTTRIITTLVGNGGYHFDSMLASSAMLTPANIEGDASGNLYMSDKGSEIWKYVAATGVLRHLAGTGNRGYSGDGGPARLATLYGPGGLCLDRSGNLYIADVGNHRIRTIAGVGPVIPPPLNTSVQGNYATTDNLLIYPSPNSGRFHVSAGSVKPGGRLQVDVLNVLGEVILHEDVVTTGTKSFPLQLPAGTAPGTYVLRIGRKSRTFVVE